MRWHRLDPTDAYFSYETQHVYVGLETPAEGDLRSAVRRMAAVNPHLFRYSDGTRWRLFTPQELADAPERLVVRESAQQPEEGLRTIAGQPLDGSNFRVHLGPDWLGLRVAHGVLFDGVTIGLLLQSLLGAEAPEPAIVVPGWRRDRLLATYLATHPRAVRAAQAYRRQIGAEGFAPPLPAPADSPVVTHARSEAVDLPTLRSLRDTHWPGASIASVVLAGVRAAMAQVDLPARSSAEVLFDVRGYFNGVRPWFGNWAAGVQLQAADELDPIVMTRAIKATAASGLPVAAMAAGRLFARFGSSGALDRPVPKPIGAPRISYTYMGGHSSQGRVPWRSEGPTWLLERTRPANAEALTVVGKEVQRTLVLNVSHYESVWPARLVREALELFLADPVGVIRTTQAEVSGARRSLQ